MARSRIEWTESTWNPTTGCTKVSPGCKNCYAEVMARRLKAVGQVNYRDGFDLTLHEHMLGRPLEWKKPQRVFVNSMSDLFHERVRVDFIPRVFDTMRQASRHSFQVLTKRSERLVQIDQDLDWPANVWMGVSIESADFCFRIDHLRRTRARVKFLSLEPLLGPIPNLKLDGIDWVILGGESGRRARPMSEEWVIEVRDQCISARVPFFFKQWGGINRKKTGHLLQGRAWREWPGALPDSVSVV